MTKPVRPSGHLQVVDRGGGRRWHALWRDADGRHQKVLGPAWVKDSGKRTARGAIVWHTANGPKPDRSYLTPADAADELRRILAAAPRASATTGGGRPVIRGRGVGVARARRAKARPEALHAQGLRLPDAQPPPSRVRRATGTRGHPPGDRALARRLRAHPHRGPGAHGARRDPPLRPAPRAHHGESDRRRRAPPRALFRRLRHVLA